MHKWLHFISSHSNGNWFIHEDYYYSPFRKIMPHDLIAFHLASLLKDIPPLNITASESKLSVHQPLRNKPYPKPYQLYYICFKKLIIFKYQQEKCNLCHHFYYFWCFSFLCFLPNSQLEHGKIGEIDKIMQTSERSWSHWNENGSSLTLTFPLFVVFYILQILCPYPFHELKTYLAWFGHRYKSLEYHYHKDWFLSLHIMFQLFIAMWEHHPRSYD
jgi:hypothetical protein